LLKLLGEERKFKMSLTRSKKIDYPQLEKATVCLLNMPKAILYIFVLLIFLAPPVYGNGLEGCEEHVKYGAPSLEPVLLCRTGYALSHDVDHKVPDWVGCLSLDTQEDERDVPTLK